MGGIDRVFQCIAQAIGQRVAALTSQIVDPVARQAQAVAMIAQDATNQAYVMAYNDAYQLTALVAAFAFCVLVLHMFRDWLAARLSPAAPAPATDPSNPA